MMVAANSEDLEFTLQNRDISPKETLVGTTWEATFGQQRAFIFNRD
jgi:hypothetical protein